MRRGRCNGIMRLEQLKWGSERILRCFQCEAWSRCGRSWKVTWLRRRFGLMGRGSGWLGNETAQVVEEDVAHLLVGELGFLEGAHLDVEDVAAPTAGEEGGVGAEEDALG